MSDDVAEASHAPVPEGYAPLPWSRGFGRAIGPLYRRADADGRSTLGLRIAEHHTNGMDNAHGGMLMTLADMGWGNAVSVERSSFWVTIRLTCDFLSAARLGDWIEAGGEVLHVEGDTFSVRGRVWAGERLLMTGVGLFKAISPREPRPGEKAFAAVESARLEAVA